MRFRQIPENDRTGAKDLIHAVPRRHELKRLACGVARHDGSSNNGIGVQWAVGIFHRLVLGRAVHRFDSSKLRLSAVISGD